MQTVNLYALCEPDTGEIRYIGMSRNPLARLSRHLSEARADSSSHKNRWVRKLLSHNLNPKMEILFEIVDASWQEFERAYIRIFRDAGCRLVNGTDGGDGAFGRKLSKETRERLRLANMGKPLSKERREKIGRANTGKSPSAEAREKLRLASTGRKHSQETREKISQCMMGNLRFLGKRHSPEAIEKIRRAKVGRKHSLEAKEKMRLARLAFLERGRSV